MARLFSAGGDVGVVGAVGGLGDGQGPFGQRAGGGRVAEVLQHHGEVAQAGGDGGWSGP